MPGFRLFYTPAAPLGLLEAGAQVISIAILNQSVDCTLQTALFKQALTVCGTRVLLAERIIPTGIMARY